MDYGESTNKYNQVSRHENLWEIKKVIFVKTFFQDDRDSRSGEWPRCRQRTLQPDVSRDSPAMVFRLDHRCLAVDGRWKRSPTPAPTAAIPTRCTAAPSPLATASSPAASASLSNRAKERSDNVDKHDVGFDEDKRRSTDGRWRRLQRLRRCWYWWRWPTDGSGCLRLL